MTNYRLGLRIAPTSIGWCALEIQKNGMPINILGLGTRVFTDGRAASLKKKVPGESLASHRTTIHGMFRRTQRAAIRKRNIVAQLINYGLLSENNNVHSDKNRVLNTLKLRNDAITQKLELHEIGIALFHLQKRRGFKSNRKEERTSNATKLTGMKLGISNLNKMLESKYTVGQYLYKRLADKNLSTKFRPNLDNKNISSYEFYPSREMIEWEFNAIWDSQKKYYPELLNDEARKVIHKAIFYQRPLKPQPKGKCTIIETDTRMDWALPSAQHFRIVKEVNNLAFNAPETMRGIKLNAEQRKKLYEELYLKDSITFKQINKLLGLSSSYKFNLEDNARPKLKGDETAKLMRNESRFGSLWDKLSLQEQDIIIGNLLNDNTEDPSYMDDETLEYWLMQTYKLSLTQVQSIIKTPLPERCSNFGITVITTLLHKMIQEGLPENTAIKECGWKTKQENINVRYDKAPYYGEVLNQHVVKNERSSDPMIKQYGRIANPSVHIALNQTRYLVDRLKETYKEWPSQIVIEVDRNLKKGTKEITKIVDSIGQNSKDRHKILNDIEGYTGIQATPENYLKMKLWTELAKDTMQRKCVFTGKTIGISMLFSDETKIGYILPYSRTLDSTNANRILMTAQAARIKNNMTPYEAFSIQSAEYSHEEILKRIHNLPESKQWRFRQDAMEIFAQKAQRICSKSSLTEENIETDIDAFAVEPLNDTHYISKIFKKYLGNVCTKGEKAVTATPGTLTPLLRSSWGLNDLLPLKTSDLRLNSINAFVATLTTRFTVRRVVEAAILEETKGTKITTTLSRDKPYSNFDWEDLQHKVNKTIVSIKPDHGSPSKNGNTSGRLHDDTYYGLIEERGDTLLLRLRVPVLSLIRDSGTKKPFPLAKIIENILIIRRDNTRKEFINIIASCTDMQDICLNFINQYHMWFTNINCAVPQPLTKEVKKDIEAKFSEIEKTFNYDKFLKTISSLTTSNVFILEEKPRNVMVVLKSNKEGRPIKFAQGGSNHHVDIYCPQSGEKAGKWQMEVIKTFDINKKGFVPLWRNQYPDAKHIMTLHINDRVAYEEDGILEIRKVKKISTNNVITLVPHNIIKEKEEDFMKGTSAKQLQLKNVRQLSIKIDSTIYDPRKTYEA